MTIFHSFLEGFCCVLPCPIGLILLAIPPLVLTHRRRKAANAGTFSSEKVFTTCAQEA